MTPSDVRAMNIARRVRTVSRQNVIWSSVVRYHEDELIVLTAYPLPLLGTRRNNIKCGLNLNINSSAFKDSIVCTSGCKYWKISFDPHPRDRADRTG
jgi:hypothetical protein